MVLGLVILDLILSAFVFVVEETRVLNPEYNEKLEHAAGRAKVTAIVILASFVVEQVGHLVAFGWSFFRKPWFVLDLLVVSVSLFLELREMREETAAEGKVQGEAYFPENEKPRRISKRAARVVMALRLWKLVAFIFDMFLAGWISHSIKAGSREALEAYVALLEKDLLRRGLPLPIK